MSSRVAAAAHSGFDRIWRSSPARGSFFFVVASGTVALANFAFHLVMSRLLGPASYGALGALINVTTVASVPLSAVQITVAQSIAGRGDAALDPPLGRLMRIASLGAVGVLVPWLAITPTLDRFFHLTSPGPTVLLGLWLVPSVLTAALQGVLLGQRRFKALSVGQLAGQGMARLVGGAVFVEFGMGVAGGVLGTVVGATVTLVVFAWALRACLFTSGTFVPRAGDALLSSLALGGAAILVSLDAWLGRHFLSARDAGLFVAATTAGNIAVFLPTPIISVYFPKMVSTGGRGFAGRQMLARVVAMVTIVSLAPVAVMALEPRMVIGLLFGSPFLHAQVAIATVALADTGVAIASAFAYFQVARRSRWALSPWLCCVLATVLAWLFHGSLEVLALDMLVSCWVLVLGLGVPTAVAALRTLADDSSTLERKAILLSRAIVDLSIVVPFYNVGRQRLATHIDRICRTLADSGVTFEVIPVSDGSTDDSSGALDDLVAAFPGVVRPIVFTQNQGKGEALRAGLAHGRGRYLGFIDGDGDIPADGLVDFVALARQQQPEIVVGSKRHRNSRVHYPAVRRLYSVGYQVLTTLLFGLTVRDTQTGIKLIRRDVLGEVLPRMVEKRFAFDLELLAVAHRIGYRQVAELPVAIGERFRSTISPVAVWRMLQDTLAVFWRLRSLRFYDAPLVEPGRELPGAGAELATQMANGERLRILVYNWRDLAHPHAGGAEVYTHRVARAWVAAGHQVTWFTSAVACRPSQELVDGISIIRRGGRYSVYREARRYWEQIGNGRFDLVIDEVNTRPFEAARWAGGTPVVALAYQAAKEVWFHELWWPAALLGRFLLEPTWLRRMRSVPTLTISESSRRSLQQYGLEDVSVVPAGMDPIDIPVVARETSPTVVFVGRLARNKRPGHAVEAFRLLKEKVPDARLWVIGTGPLEEELRRHAPADVEFLGRVSEREKVDRLARAHCLVATSVREGWGLTVTEAAQVGTPTIAYDVDGLRDSVTASGGILSAPTPSALADALGERLPTWSMGRLPPVQPGGVMDWSDVAAVLLASAVAAVDRRQHADAKGEDVTVAWRRAVGPVAAACDRRAWVVAGIGALVAVAPASQLGSTTVADILAGIAFGAFCLGTIGAWADAVRTPLHRRNFRPSESEGSAQARPTWNMILPLGILAGAAVQGWVAAGLRAPGSRAFSYGAAWLRQLGTAFSPGRGPSGMTAALELPMDATMSGLHLVGIPAVVDARLVESTIFAMVLMAMAWMLLSLGVGVVGSTIGAVVYGFSPFVMAMSGLDVAYLAAMALVPGTVAWIVTVVDDGRFVPTRLLWAVPAALLGGLVAGSPPLLAACGMAAAATLCVLVWVFGRGRVGPALRRSLGGLGLTLLLSAYWLVPFVLALTSSHLMTAAAHRQWQWSEANATLANSFWLNTSFDWQVTAQAAAFGRFPLVFLRYVVPIGSFMALGIAIVPPRDQRARQRLRVMVVAASVVLVTILVATGTRQPGSLVFQLLTALPFGWLFNDPGRFLFIAGIGYGVLAATAVDQVTLSRRWRLEPSRSVPAIESAVGSSVAEPVTSGVHSTESNSVSAVEPQRWVEDLAQTGQRRAAISIPGKDDP